MMSSCIPQTERQRPRDENPELACVVKRARAPIAKASDTTAKRARRDTSHRYSSTIELLQCVVRQTPRALLCFLDALTQRALRHLVHFRDNVLLAARRMWDPDWFNIDFLRILLAAPRDTHRRCVSDVRLLIVPVSWRPEACATHKGAWNRLFDGCTDMNVSLWEATPWGLALRYFQWKPTAHSKKWSTKRKRRPPLIINVTELFAISRVVLQRGWSFIETQPGSTTHTFVVYDRRQDPHHIDPARWHMHASFPAEPTLKTFRFTVIVDVECARQHAVLEPLIATMPAVLH